MSNLSEQYDVIYLFIYLMPSLWLAEGCMSSELVEVLVYLDLVAAGG